MFVQFCVRACLWVRYLRVLKFRELYKLMEITVKWSHIVPDLYQNTKRIARENLKPSFYELLSRASCEFNCNGLLLFSYDFFSFFFFVSFFFRKLHERLREPRGQNVRLIQSTSVQAWRPIHARAGQPCLVPTTHRRLVRNEVAKDANETRGKKWRRSKRVQPEELRTGPNWRVSSAVAAFGLCLSTHQITIFILKRWEVNACYL